VIAEPERIGVAGDWHGNTAWATRAVRKMAALLQADTAGTRPILLRVESRAGHGQGKPVTKLVEEQADEWTFVAWQLGLRVR